MACWPSSRVRVVERGVKPPALTSRLSDASDGENASAGPGQGAPFAPPVIANVLLE
jgi:hypothetical protein